MNNESVELRKTARAIKKDVIDMMYKGGWEYPGKALSCINIITVLYYKLMNLRPDEPKWEERDRLILSKGFACPSVYAALANKGYYNKSWIYTFRQLGSKLQGNPDMNRTEGIDMTVGLPSNGLSAGFGMAAVIKLRNSKSRVFVLLGDDELSEGIVWEAAASAVQLRADNLIAILDYNHNLTNDIANKSYEWEPLADKWKAFGWRVLELNGEDIDEILSKLEIALVPVGRPTILIVHNVVEDKVKGEGSTLHDAEILTEDMYIQIMEELNHAEGGV